MNVARKKPVWIPPKIWEGETVFILGGGPSLLQSPLHLIHNERVLGVNDAFTLGNWVDACYFGDCQWWEWNRNEFREEYGGLRMTSCQRLYNLTFIKTWKRGKPRGIETEPGHIAWNYNSGLSAINVAYHLGAVKIVLLGFDMKVNDKTQAANWHTRYKRPPTPKIYKDKWLPCIPFIMKDARTLGVDIVNATIDTNISGDLIRKVKLEECIL